MLSDDTVNHLVDILAQREEEISNKVLQLIAERIGRLGKLSTSDILKLTALIKSGNDMKKINKYLSELTGKQVKDIKYIIDKAAREAYKDSKQFYELMGKDYIPYEENAQLQRVVKAIAKQTSDTYKNLSNTRAFMIRDKGRLRPTKISVAYNKLIDEAIQSSQSGLTTWEQDKKRIVKELINSGIRTVEYTPDTGRRYTQRVDTSVRRCILDGIRAINQGVQDEVGKQYGANGKEITVHAYPAPDHAPIQGHQFTNEEFDKMQNHENFIDVKGNRFSGFERSIGMWNCRHFAFSIIIGYAKPNYTDAELKEIIDKNNEGFTTSDGKHMTMYECTQMQRKYELDIRKNKEAYILANKADVEELASVYKKKVTKLTKQYKTFSKSCGLSVRNNNLFVADYR